ncbi:hypothetical protein C7S18_01465 [Ahniella affigens]|uniref:P/Homo B domain-containing protein n=1 Tax=Ahniella affigens TaxID=2021234 RepID=A0A2P1PM82_9GAMM|nr:hypothetical protein [Ahniella affigens]AVP95946.1 hypothetical protein C7S18_01465 [Ahniella affigens]
MNRHSSHSLFPAALIGLALLFTTATSSAQETSCVASGGTNCTFQIPDGPQLGLTSTINVPAASCARGINHVEINVDATHSWIGDLQLVVTGPNAATATLLSGLLGASPPATCSGDDVLVAFSDGAPLPVCNGSVVPSLSGVAGPVQPIAPTAGTIAGTWSLTVTDLANGNSGLLNDWSVDVVCNPQEVPASSDFSKLMLGMLLALTAMVALFRLRR